MNMQKLTVMLLAIWLILVGLSGAIGFNSAGFGQLIVLLGVITGVLLLWQPGALTSRTRWGVPLLAIWLIVQNLTALARFNFPGMSLLLALLAVCAGVLLLLEK